MPGVNTECGRIGGTQQSCIVCKLLPATACICNICKNLHTRFLFVLPVLQVPPKHNYSILGDYAALRYFLMQATLLEV